ncbi:hypothetical protein [Streptomyces sp. F-1]|uniref:hypothetical protein n=1 Tax=Streptomyces sp. F-1 TaxID=463642 RepID=UPI00085BF5DC|nr:hypothetical protein [Streptomyces sp. F-1]SFY52669.1 hypothetical protein STEPF1_05942 [Streptomyces sp. F-1]
MGYLHLGAIHLRTYLRYQSLLTRAENDRLDHAVRAGLGAAAMFLDMALRNAAGGAGAPDFIDQLGAAVPAVPLLNYLYFEVLAEYLMLQLVVQADHVRRRGRDAPVIRPGACLMAINSPRPGTASKY